MVFIQLILYYILEDVAAFRNVGLLPQQVPIRSYY